MCMPGSRSRAILIGSLISGGGATVIVLLTITLTYRRRRNRNITPRTTGNTLKRLPPKSRQTTTVEPFMDLYPTTGHPPRSPTQALSHRRSTSAASYVSTSESSMVPSVVAPATVGVSEVEPLQNTLNDAREEERFMRRVRKFRDQVADLRRWAEQRRSSRPSPALDI